METSCLDGIWDRMSEYIEIVNCIYDDNADDMWSEKVQFYWV